MPRVERIAIVNQLARGPQKAIDRVGEMAGQLFHPRAIRLRMDPGDVHAAGLELDQKEDEVPSKTGQRHHLDREQVGRRQAVPLRLQKCLPRRALTALGRRLNPMVLQNPLDRVPRDGVAEIRQRVANPRVAPTVDSRPPSGPRGRRSLWACSAGLAVFGRCRRISRRLTGDTTEEWCLE